MGDKFPPPKADVRRHQSLASIAALSGTTVVSVPLDDYEALIHDAEVYGRLFQTKAVQAGTSGLTGPALIIKMARDDPS